MSIHRIASSMALHTGLGLAGVLTGGAAAGSASMRASRQSRRDAFDVFVAPEAIIGAVIAPTAFHGLKPLVVHGLQHGAADALRTAPPLIFRGLTMGALFGGAAMAGVVLGGTVTDDGLREGSQTALPGAAMGAVAGPVLCAGMRGVLGAGPGSLVFVALAASITGWQVSRQH